MFEKNAKQPSYVVVDRPPLSDKELAGVFAWAEDDPKVLAILQLIGTLELEALEEAINNIGNTPVAASNVGSVEACRELRERFLMLREKGHGAITEGK